MKKKLIYLLLFFVIAVSLVFGFLVFNKQQNNTEKFSLSEQQWIEKNKNNIIDFYVPSNIDIFSYVGKGVFFDYLDSFTEYTKLKINPISYKLGSDTKLNSYAFELVDDAKKNQILLYKDNYVLLSKNEYLYDSINEFDVTNVGVLTSDLKNISNYIDNELINYVTFDTLEELITELNQDESTIDSAVILKTFTLDSLFSNELHINYQFKDLTKSYVITLKGNDTLNSIIKKYYHKWSKSNFTISYNNHLLSEYFDYNNITEIEKNTLQEKKYVYGFVSNGAYDIYKNDKLSGINYQIIKSFASFANIDMDYKDEYLSYTDLLTDFSKNKIDLFFNNGSYKLDSDYFETIKNINTNIVILSNVKNPIYVSNFKDLTKYTIVSVKNSLIAKNLKAANIDVKTYNSLEKLLVNLKSDSIVAIDLENYEYYKAKELVNFKIVYQYKLDEKYNYIVNSQNKIFYDLFDFYLEYMPINDVIIESYNNIYHVDGETQILLILVIIMALMLLLEFIGHLRKLFNYLKTRTRHTLSKNDKLKYVDQLTSLKNRSYLNDNIENWDNSSIYPQSIIIISLNDLTEINGNFGYEEGDKVILEAANILIRTQLPNTEIIRTDGSEFLIYMIEYDEKQTVAYMKRLNRELKDLSHGYGAVSGYSIITDGIKTIDDAINEATLDVKTNKELQDESNMNN